MSSICSIESDDSRLSLSSSANLSAFTISTMAGGATKTVNINISYGEMEEPYVDTGIIVTIRNSISGQEWKDYVPLRFFKGMIPITISAVSPEENNNAALNGFVIYPDGNNQFFSIKNNSNKVLFVPSFGADKKYKMVFLKVLCLGVADSNSAVLLEKEHSLRLAYDIASADNYALLACDVCACALDKAHNSCWSTWQE